MNSVFTISKSSPSSISFLTMLTLVVTLFVNVNANATDYDVTTGNDSGAGSFRAAITTINGLSSGNHMITFQSLVTVNLTSALPALTYSGGAVVIRGGDSILNGDNLSGTEVGLVFQGGAVILEDMDIIRFPSHGIHITADNCRVSKCNIGTRGSTDMGNDGHGIFIENASNVTIGGEQGGNTISGNNMCGIRVFNCTDVTITRNKIGLDNVARDPLGNTEEGIYLLASNGCQIGAALPADRNYVGANGSEGILLNAANSNTILGNFIGIDSQQEAVPNGTSGIHIANSQNNIVGGSEAGEGNVISGNTGSGVTIESPASGNIIHGNKIGTNEAGTQAVPNSFSGVNILSGENNTIGGDVEGAGNVISGNAQAGVYIQNFATNNHVLGNYIGTDATGETAIPNVVAGVYFYCTSENTVGGTTPESGNVISGNTGYGIRMDGSESQACLLNSILGNKIGTNADGALALANGSGGILVQDAASNTIGGSEVGAGNLISGNDGSGIYMNGSLVYGNMIYGNKIGLTMDGSAALANSGDGVSVAGLDNEIGGIDAGSGNVISGNTLCGVRIGGSDTSGTSVKGNYIGTDAAGAAAVPNGSAGIAVQESSDNAIGGADAGAGNLIAGNTGAGIEISGSGGTADNNTIKGNVIGFSADKAKSGAANGGAGVWISGTMATGNLVGGTSSGESNTISYNLNGGIWLTDGASHNTFTQNSIFGNSVGGIVLDAGTNDDIVTPQITGIDINTGNVGGFGAPNSVVELFVDDSGQGKIFLTSTTSNGSGDFGVTTSLIPYDGMNLTATFTNASGNTSEFSDPWLIPALVVEMTMTRDTPALYYPNQIIEIALHVDYTGSGTLTNVAVLETPPAGWQFREVVSGPTPDAQPSWGANGPFAFTWNSTIPSFPMDFTYSVYVPTTQMGEVLYTGIAGYQAGGPELQTDPVENAILEGIPEVQYTRVVNSTYSPASTFDVTVHLEYPTGPTPTISALAILEEAPANWTFVGLLGGNLPSSGPSIGSQGPFNFAYSSGAVPAFPIEFSYRVQVPGDQTGTVNFSGYAGFRITGVTREYESNTYWSSVDASGVEGEGAEEGEGEGSAEGGVEETHTADQNGDNLISLSELLRVIQFFNSNGLHCEAGTEDGYAPGPGSTACAPHASDYNAQDWLINLSELLRIIQFFNSGGYHYCPGESTEDGYCPGI